LAKKEAKRQLNKAEQQQHKGRAGNNVAGRVFSQFPN